MKTTTVELNEEELERLIEFVEVEGEDEPYTPSVLETLHRKLVNALPRVQ